MKAEDFDGLSGLCRAHNVDYSSRKGLETSDPNQYIVERLGWRKDCFSHTLVHSSKENVR